MGRGGKTGREEEGEGGTGGGQGKLLEFLLELLLELLSPGGRPLKTKCGGRGRERGSMLRERNAAAGAVVTCWETIAGNHLVPLPHQHMRERMFLDSLQDG